MIMKYSKGLWEFKPNYDNMGDADLKKEGVSGTIRGDGWNIARIWQSAPNHAEDARLIAACPDLLAEHEEWAKLFGNFVVRALQGDTREMVEFAREAKIDYIDGEPVLHSEAIKKATE